MAREGAGTADWSRRAGGDLSHRLPPYRRPGHVVAAGRGRRAAAGLAALLVGAGGLVSAATLLATPAGAATVAGTWTTTGPLSPGRSGATATLLGDGLVLVAGGETSVGASPTSSAELYDPANGSWLATASLPLAVTRASAVLLASGDVLVAGGEVASGGSLVPTGAAEIYSPSQHTWSSAGTLPAGLAEDGAVAVRLPDGDALFAGGTTGTGSSTASTSASELYNPATNSWAAAGSLPLGVAHAAGASFTAAGGGVLVAGGVTQYAGGSAGITDLAEVYNPSTGSWTAKATLPAAMAGGSAAVLGGGNVLVAGGATSIAGAPTSRSELYDPSTGGWAPTGALPFASYDATATLLSTGSVLYAGGFTSGSGSVTASAAIYDPSTRGWASTGALHVGRALATATALPGGRVLVAGGQTSASGVTGDAELFDGETTPPVITSASSFSVTSGHEVTFTVAARGTPVPSLSISGRLPDGMTFTPHANGTATITGVPSATGFGTYVVVVTATNGTNPPAVQYLHITLLQGNSAPQITNPATLDLRAGVYARFDVTSIGTPTPTVSLSGRLPLGMTFEAIGGGNGYVLGAPAPSAAGSYPVTITASNGIGTPAHQVLTIVVAAPPAPPKPAGPPPGGGARGYWYVTSNGLVLHGGDAALFPTHSRQGPRQIVAAAATSGGKGYYLVSSFGGVFNYGNARFFGSLARTRLASPVVAFALMPGDRGYYLVTREGAIYRFGDARDLGQPGVLTGTESVAAFAVAPSGRGYWVVTRSGAVFPYGDVYRYSSLNLNTRTHPVVAFAPTPDGHGYWVVTSKGNIFNYGDAHFYGSAARRRIPPVTAFAATPDGDGYWFVTARGNIFNYGAAHFYGSAARIRLPAQITGFAAAS